MAKIHIEVTEEDVKGLIRDYISGIMGNANGNFDPEKVRIEVKSKQNYKSEWEQASIRAIYETT